MTYDKDKEIKTKSQFMRSIIVLFSKHFHCNFHENQINRQCHGIALARCLSLSLFYLRMELLWRKEAQEIQFSIRELCCLHCLRPNDECCRSTQKSHFNHTFPLNCGVAFSWKNLSFFWFDSVSCHNSSCFCTHSSCHSLRFTISVSVSHWHCVMQQEEQGTFWGLDK